MRHILVAIVICFAACGGDSTRPALTTPVSPTPNNPVVPASPPFGLAGLVSDTLGRPLAQARVEVRGGIHNGAFAVTDGTGAFSFEAIFTEGFTLRASKEGYREESLAIQNARSARFFRLQSANGSLDLRGNYEVTFVVDAACTDIPASARTRTYSASLEQAGSFYLGTLRGADFAQGSPPGYSAWNVLYVSAFEDLAHVYFSDPPIWEHLTPESDLVIYGDALGAIRADSPPWSFAGTVGYCAEPEPDSYPECEVPEIVCRGQDHHLTFTRK